MQPGNTKKEQNGPNHVSKLPGVESILAGSSADK